MRFNLFGAAFVTAYGFAAWDWGTTGFHVEDEGWLEEDTKHGGVDKLGHMWTGAVIGGIAAHRYGLYGYEPRRAALYGAGSSMLFTTVVELGDGISGEHGFSWEDMAFNAAGAGFELARRWYPEFGERVHFRWEWFPSRTFREGETDDPTTDYAGSRYFLAFPLRAWGVDQSPFRWLELQAGFLARGYDDDAEFYDRERAAFLGVGVNVTAVIEAWRGHSARHVFDYFQLPGVSAWAEFEE